VRADGATVVGTVVARAVVAGTVSDVRVVPLVELVVDVASLCRGVVPVEQPSAESAAPTKMVNRQAVDHRLARFDDVNVLVVLERALNIEAERQLASWTTSASPTLA
jgi:hypothetical protein